MITLFRSLTALMAGLIVSGCATMFSSGSVSIEVKSDPPGAQFRFGTFKGTTPTMISVPRKALKEHSSIYFTKEGYDDTTVPIVTRIQNITWLGILFWPSIVIDIANANAYELDAPNISASLVPTQNSEQSGTRAGKNIEMESSSSHASGIASVQSLTPTQSIDQMQTRDTKNRGVERPLDGKQLQAGVVKLTARSSGGAPKAGTGFIVQIDGDAVYIITAAHVVAGDPQPSVEFFTKRNILVPSEVLGLEGDDEVRGLALLVVKGQGKLPKGLKALHLAETIRLSGGEDVIMIGFPRNAGPWAVVKGNISSRQGRDLYFSPAVDEGYSGGPIIQSGKAIGVVGVTSQTVGRGVTAPSVRDYIDGFGISSPIECGFGNC